MNDDAGLAGSGGPHMKKLVLMLLATAWMGDAAAQTITFGSDRTWGVFSGDPSRRSHHAYGTAQPVCLDATTPASCAPGSTLYSYTGGWSGAWSADLSPIPGAEWIWAPCTTQEALADGREYFFSNTFLLPGVPTAGTLSLAVDDWAEVIVNGVVVPLPDGRLSVGSRTDPSVAGAAQTALVTFDLLPYLREGSNVISVHAANGPKEFAGSTVACTYAQNPAGVVFGGAITYSTAVCR